MLLRRRMMLLAWCVVCAVAVSAEEAPQGLVNTDHDLVAEASHTGYQSKREASLLNSYGEPLPADAYGPPQEIAVVTHVSDIHPSPAPVYGPPEVHQTYQEQPPPGAYGPPSPISLPSQIYEGPPPPKPKPYYGPPRLIYGTPKPSHPKHSYGPPKYNYKKNFGIKQSLPKPSYGTPFKPPKLFGTKHTYGPPKQMYAPSKPIYGPPKYNYGPPVNVPFQHVPLPEVSSVTVTSNIGNIANGLDVGLNLPAPIYGTPISSIPPELKPTYPVPLDNYGPPPKIAEPLGPIGPPVEQIVVQDESVINYGPPQPDPNPQPPHPGIPAPPTPPHVVYDGWKPIPGVPNPVGFVENVHDEYGPPPQVQTQEQHFLDQDLPPALDQHQQFYTIESQSTPVVSQKQQFSSAQINTGYSSVHQDALANIDLNAIVGGDTNNIDQAKTVFEAHYTDNNNLHINHNNHVHGSDVTFIQSTVPEKTDSYISPPIESLSGGPYPSSLRSQGAKLLPPSGIYGVPPGSQYGAPPKPLPTNLPIPYGTISGGPHYNNGWPKHPIKFREPVPNGLLEHVGHTTHGKDTHGIDHFPHGPTYISPPIRDIKESHHSSNFGQDSLSITIEPSNLYSLPHSEPPLTFHQHQPSSTYGSPIDSYSVPLLTVGDHTASGSSQNAVTTTIDGSILANLSNLDAAAILKHCPYHEAIIKAAKSGEKIPEDLAIKYLESLNSLGSTLAKNEVVPEQNIFNIPVSTGQPVTFNTKGLTTVPTVHTVHPRQNKIEVTNNKQQREISKHKEDKIQQVSEEIYKTSQKIQSLNEETKRLQQKITATNFNFNQIHQHNHEIPVKGKLGTYSLQIQSSNGKGNPSIPHEQLLSEGLLQSILQAIEQPTPNGQIVQTHVQHQNVASQNSHTRSQDAATQNVHHTRVQDIATQTHSEPNFFNQQINTVSNFHNEGLVLPDGYEPIDRTKDHKDLETQSSSIDLKKMLKNEIQHKHRGDIPDCEQHKHFFNQNTAPEPKYEIKPVQEIEDNDVAVYFKRKNGEKSEPVTEISVATSISESLDNYNGPKKSFGDKIKKN